MVHALIVARGLLRPHGVLVDLRNDRFASIRARHDQVYCLIGNRRLYAGPLIVNKPLADFRAADLAIREVVRRGLFRLRTAEVFEVRSYSKTAAHLEKYAAKNPYVTVGDATRRRLGILLRRHPAAQILVVARTRLNVLVKTETPG
jgi:hypothetical protein